MVTSPSDYMPSAEEMHAHPGRTVAGDQVAAGAEGVRHHRSLRFRDCQHAGAGERQRQIPLPKRRTGLPATRCGSHSASSWICATAKTPTRRPPVFGRLRDRASPTRRQLQGKELSYNNIVDLHAAWDLAQEFEQTVCAIIKHTNPAAAPPAKPWPRRMPGPWSAIRFPRLAESSASNRPVDGDAAARRWPSCSWRPSPRPRFDAGGAAKFASKKNLRLVEVASAPPSWVLKNVSGGMLAAGRRRYARLQESELKVVTSRQPTAQEMSDLLFAWKVCKHVKSNAILYARDGQTWASAPGR